MKIVTIISIIIIIVFFSLILYLISTNNQGNNQGNNQINNFNQISNDYLIKENHENIPGYTNELMYENNLKGGDYVNQFKEIDFSMIPKSNNQIGFNPEPRDSSQIKLPYADINVNCL